MRCFMPMLFRSPFLLVPFLLGCPAPEEVPVVPDATFASLECGAAEAVVALSTEDGETLIADYHPAPEANRGVVILLHMAPTSGFNRSNWPVDLREQFADVGVGVLNLDRRGAGDSTGDAEAAAVGDGGRLDVEAAVRALLAADTACAVNPARIQLMGASNGSTAAFDYAVAHASDLPDIDSLVFLSPGTYTENQHRFDEGFDLSFPLLWVYPSNESYAQGFIDDAPAEWEFLEAGDSHGTQMFQNSALRVEVGNALTGFLEATAGR